MNSSLKIRKEIIGKEFGDWTCGSNCRALQRLTVLPTAPQGWSKHPTQCACVRVDFQNPRFLPLETMANISIMCASGDSRGKNYRWIPFFLESLAFVEMRKPPSIRYAKKINNLRSSRMIMAKFGISNWPVGARSRISYVNFTHMCTL